MNESYEFRAKTVDEAIADGLAALSLRRDQVEVEILNKGSRGIFGIGSEPAVVRLVPLDSISQGTSSPAAPVTDTLAPPSPHTGDRRGQGESLDVTTAARNDQRTVLETTDEDEEYSDEDLDLADEIDDERQDEGVVAQAVDADDTEDEELSDLAHGFLSEMVRLMGFDAQVTAVWKGPEPGEDEPALMLNVTGRDLGALIGRRGDTLASLQYLLRLMVNQRLRAWKNIVVDVEGYKEKRAEQLTQLAQRMAEQVVETDRALSLEPMPASERRIIHITLRDHPDVYTESSGEGDRRKVHIVPRRMRD